MGRPGAVGLQALRDDSQKSARHLVQYRPITLHEVAQPLWHRQNPLAHRQPGENMIAEVCWPALANSNQVSKCSAMVW